VRADTTEIVRDISHMAYARAQTKFSEVVVLYPRALANGLLEKHISGTHAELEEIRSGDTSSRLQGATAQLAS